ncbi:MAG TPA: ATP-dependent DNA helicase RecG [Actinomycetota bacterium]|jgi:ATP-dependent DNA helicase RecG|nr:ATP-dependent DNA helicase RecG [Actinomycetota bacterium]
MPLTTADPIVAIDGRLASRRMGRSKGPEARVVLADALGIETVGQLLHHYPRRYIDRSLVLPIGELKIDAFATVIATVRSVKKRQTRRRQAMVTVTIGDGTGFLDLTFFNQPWAAGLYREGMEVAVSGTVQLYRHRLQLGNQEIEVLRSDEQDLVHTGRITPVHRAVEGISPRTIRELVWRAIEQLPPLPDPIPDDVRAAESLTDRDQALRWIHFPDDQQELETARERLKFDELFTLELGVGFRRRRLAAERTGIAHTKTGPLLDAFDASLPFEPTDAQRRTIDEVDRRMAAPQPMNLLLQGDVGSGKTLVAVHACLVAIASGHQAAIMAPTEVLAGQHLRSVTALLAGVGGAPYLDTPDDAPRDQGALFGDVQPAAPSLTYALLSGSVTGTDRERVVKGAADGSVDLVIGTHALVQDGVTFADLSLAVIDEQHRFGLHQRTALSGKGAGDIDVLIMTATPIPRTLALTYYGDLDVALIDEMPAGRRPVRTRAARTTEDRAAAEVLVREEVAAGHQAFVVCAAIDEGNRTQVRAAEAEAERLRTDVFPELEVALLHGRMRPKEKDRTMERFRAGDADVLISTTVIEVGVDVPNATVMLVENAERFGLAQLHQLRGRIGRSGLDATCVLFDASEPTNEEARARIDAMVATTDGFALADEDLRLRGEGTLFDVRQSGMPDLKLARLAEDVELIGRARDRAFALIDDDPTLEGHAALRAELEERFAGSIDWLFRS